MDGDVHIDEVERAIGYDLPRDDVETIAGVLIAACGALPAVGDTVTIALPIDPSELAESQPIVRHLEVDVLSIERHIPTSVRVTLIEQPIAEDNQ